MIAIARPRTIAAGMMIAISRALISIPFSSSRCTRASDGRSRNAATKPSISGEPDTLVTPFEAPRQPDQRHEHCEEDQRAEDQRRGVRVNTLFGRHLIEQFGHCNHR